MPNEYEKKRNFEITPEPKASGKKESGRIFAVQHHIASRDHFDLRLSYGGELLSWAVPKGPSFAYNVKRLAVRVENHPLDYADFEGVIPKGQYGGGIVQLWDFGQYEECESFEKGLKDGSLKFRLFGSRLKGKFALIQTDGKNWLLMKEKDGFASDTLVAEDFYTSVKSGRNMREIECGADLTAATNPFDGISPQLAVKGETLPEGADFAYEIKYDGYRTTAFAEADKVRLLSRNGIDCTERFKSVAEKVRRAANGRAMVLDGETVAADEKGRPSFDALQSGGTDKTSLRYVVFDLLALDGKDLRSLPLRERRRRLDDLSVTKYLSVSEQTAAKDGVKLLLAAQKIGLEGIVAKNIFSPYTGGRGNDWVKVKCRKSDEFIVAGYLTDEDARLKSLLLAAYKDGKLTYAGKVGTGFSERQRASLPQVLAKAKRGDPPQNAPEIGKKEKAFWLRPEIVAEVEYAEKTASNVLRQPSFKAFRDDKSSSEITFERQKEPPKKTEAKPKVKPVNRRKVAQGKTDEKTENGAENANDGETELCGVKISSPTRIVFNVPRLITKQEVAEYYEAAAQRMLPFLKDRALSVVRCYDGVRKECFFKKHPTTKSEESVTVVGEKNEEYIAVSNVESLIRQVQLGSLEFHIQGSRADNADCPDILVFDIDPDEGVSQEKVKKAALDLKEMLDGVGLVSFLKTSGGKGYHVTVPTKAEADYKKVGEFCRAAAEYLEKKYPDSYTSNIRKAARKGRQFIDWLRNGKGATSVCPYSLRAREGAKVAMPIYWEELKDAAPDFADIAVALKRLRQPDPWRDFFEILKSH